MTARNKSLYNCDARLTPVLPVHVFENGTNLYKLPVKEREVHFLPLLQKLEEVSIASLCLSLERDRRRASSCSLESMPKSLTLSLD
jgi:hypothetical protein